MEDGEADGEHHDCRGRVGYPHGDEPGRNHEPEDNHLGLCSNDFDNVQRYASVKVPLLDRSRQEETTQEKEDGAGRVRSGGFSKSLCLRQWKHNEWYEGGC